MVPRAGGGVNVRQGDRTAPCRRSAGVGWPYASGPTEPGPSTRPLDGPCGSSIWRST